MSINITSLDTKADEIYRQLKENSDPVTKECVEDLFSFYIGPEYMKTLGFELGEDDIWRKK